MTEQLDLLPAPPSRDYPTEVLGLPVEFRQLPPALARLGTGADFDDLWARHPPGFETMTAPGGAVVTIPRWQAQIGRRYAYPGAPSVAHPGVSGVMASFLRWAVVLVDKRLNGAVVNWYDAALGHYIGQHSDRSGQLVPGAPIVSISLGATRVWRFSRKGERSVDVPAEHGSVLVLPYATNQGLMHGIVRPRRGETGRRISLTVRAFR